jgi:hypothetical protein
MAKILTNFAKIHRYTLAKPVERSPYRIPGECADIALSVKHARPPPYSLTLPHPGQVKRVSFRRASLSQGIKEKSKRSKGHVIFVLPILRGYRVLVSNFTLSKNPRETREGWALLTVESPVNEASKRTYERGSFLDWFVGLVVPVQDNLVLPWLI